MEIADIPERFERLLHTLGRHYREERTALQPSQAVLPTALEFDGNLKASLIRRSPEVRLGYDPPGGGFDVKPTRVIEV